MSRDATGGDSRSTRMAPYSVCIHSDTMRGSVSGARAQEAANTAAEKRGLRVEEPWDSFGWIRDGANVPRGAGWEQRNVIPSVILSRQAKDPHRVAVILSRQAKDPLIPTESPRSGR